MKFLWNRGRTKSTDPLAELPDDNEIHLGRHHLRFTDGDWQLLSSTIGASAPVQPALDPPPPELIVDLSKRIHELEAHNHELAFRNKLLIAMCTISEGDRRVAEAEAQDALRRCGQTIEPPPPATPTPTT